MKNDAAIFGNTAPAYYAAGISVIPLHKREKKPIPFEWSKYANTPIEPQTQAHWLDAHSEGNIGLVLGSESGMIMIDIDTEDEGLKNAIIAALPYSPWHRFGRKGMMLAYRWTPIKTHRIKNISAETIVECLSSKTQCVIPPSIHPDTLRPYTANVELLSVYKNLQPLPDNVEEILRKVISDYGVQLSHSGWTRVTDHVSKGSRDTSLTELAGLFAFAVVRGERTLKEAIGMLHAYHAEYVTEDANDQVGVDKHVENLIKFLHRDIVDKSRILPKGWDAGYAADELIAMGVTLTIDNTAWSFSEILTYLKEEFQNSPTEQGRSEAVERIMARIAKTDILSKIDEDRILKYVIDVGGLGVPMGTLKARLRELRSGGVKGTDHSDLARAVLKDLEVTNIVRYHNSKFMKWGGSHWLMMEKNPILNHISTNYGHMDACKKFSDMNGIMNLLAVVMENGICKKDVKGINFSNGFLTEELKLMPHDPDYGMTYTLPFRYTPEESGKFPMFAQFLTTAWGPDADYEDKVLALQEAICVTMFNIGSRFQRAILLHGAPKSGKTQLLRIIQSIVPNEAKCFIPPEDWGDKYLPAEMHNKILNVCGELSDKKLIDGQKFKEIVDGSDMSGQVKYGQPFSFKPTLTHWFASNHIPKTTDTSFGFIRRWLMITFHHPVSATERKADIGELIVAEEREAIVAWATLALSGIIKRGEFTLPSSHTELENEFANMNNSVRHFIKESGKVRLNVYEGHVTEMVIFNSYWAFSMGAGGQKPVGAPKFRAMMRELGGELGFTMSISESGVGSSQAVFNGLNMI